jgi:hypothetical protein
MPAHGGFDFTGDYPSPMDDDFEVDAHRVEGFDALVDRLMALNGYERDEAEAVAENILMDDAA